MAHLRVECGFSRRCSLMVFLGLQVCRPKELLIGLLEQLEQDDPDIIAESILLLLIPLQKGEANISFFLFCSFLVRH